MPLTKRQQEFLRCIFDQYLKQKAPIHYTTIARMLGVSKWTAYDMLKRLGKAGYLSFHYGTGERGNPGRSQLFYLPTSKLKQLLGYDENGQNPDWLAWKELLVNRVRELRPEAGRPALEELINDLLPRAKGPINYCACLIALFVAYLKVGSGQGTELVRQVSDLIKGPEQRLALFSGTIVGILSGEPAAGRGKGLMTGLISKFHQQLAGIDLKQHHLLAGLLNELLAVT